MEASTDRQIRNAGGNRERAILLGAAALFVIALLFPGDIPWINDEPHLIGNALQANQDGRIEWLGMKGTMGFQYGPVPTTFYQAALLLTHDLVAISLVKNALFTAFLLWTCFALAKELDYPRFPVLFVMVSPFIYFYNRALWDVNFLVTLSLPLFLLSARFLRAPSVRDLALAGCLIVVLYHIHVMAVFIIVPCVAVMSCFSQTWLRQHLRAVLAVAAAIILACLPYTIYAFKHLSPNPSMTATFGDGLVNGVYGIKFFTYPEFISYFIPEITDLSTVLPPAAIGVIGAVTLIAIALFMAGLARAVQRLYRGYTERAALTVEDKMAVLCIVCILVNVCFTVGMRRMHHPHYLNSVWFAFFFFLWFATARLPQRPWANGLLGMYFGAMLVMWLAFITHIHHNAGNRTVDYGHTLNNQIEVVGTVLNHSDPQVNMKVATIRYYGRPYAVLKDILRDEITPGIDGKGFYRIDYRDGESGWITVEPFDLKPDENRRPQDLDTGG